MILRLLASLIEPRFQWKCRPCRRCLRTVHSFLSTLQSLRFGNVYPLVHERSVTDYWRHLHW